MGVKYRGNHLPPPPPPQNAERVIRQGGVPN